MAGKNLPRINRVDFYRLDGFALFKAIKSAIATHADEWPSENLTRDHESLAAWAGLLIDVPNGGFAQFFFNARGEWGVESVADLLDSLEVPKAGPLLRDALAVYRRNLPRFNVENPWDGLFGSIKEFLRLDKSFMSVLLRASAALEKWVRTHISSIVTGDDGGPIDWQFTGSVETYHSNGLVHKYLEVKKGKPSGAYREFFDDGTVRQVFFYRSGKVSGDFWPDGTLKHKESKRGLHTIIEWFNPSGKIQKRFVKDKRGHAVEPVRMFHENGQLAEELHVVEGENRGSWRKYFDDGSPELEAEYGPSGELIVHNAWDDHHQQVVRDGTGTFRNDRGDINTPYSLFSASLYSDVTELRNGIPNGKKTTYFQNVLRSISYCTDGVYDGDATHYWDNGRVRSVIHYVNGHEHAKKSFPKFDKPVPAVVLSIDANEKLYADWQHIAVDEYPCVLNLDEVRQQLQVPDFLQEVHDRNLANATKSDYESWYTFEDGISYAVMVSETGDVADVIATGSSVYSHGLWEAYRPLLRKLRFQPGRIRGHAVACRVLARVDHTFVEGKTSDSH